MRKGRLKKCISAGMFKGPSFPSHYPGCWCVGEWGVVHVCLALCLYELLPPRLAHRTVVFEYLPLVTVLVGGGHTLRQGSLHILIMVSQKSLAGLEGQRGKTQDSRAGPERQHNRDGPCLALK